MPGVGVIAGETLLLSGQRSTACGPATTSSVRRRPIAIGKPRFYLAASDLVTGTVTKLLIQAPQCHQHRFQMTLADFPGCQSSFKLSAYRGSHLDQLCRAVSACQMSKVMSGGIVKALAVWLQAALAFHRHIGEDTRESRGLLAKALDREIALRSFSFCYQFGIEPCSDSFATGTTHDVPTSTCIRVSGLFNLKLADRSSAHPIQRSTESESARGKRGVYRYHFARISQRDLSPMWIRFDDTTKLSKEPRNELSFKSPKLYFQYNAQVRRSTLRRRMFAAVSWIGWFPFC
jgi:hypothetical protein